MKLSERMARLGTETAFEVLVKARALEAQGRNVVHLEIGEPVTPDTEVVVIRFPPPGPGESVRLRIRETYTDPGRYRLEGEELVWDRSFGRPFNALLLPEGWYLTGCSIPATVSEDAGRIRLDFVNPRPDAIDVLVTARRRVATPGGS